MKICVVYYSSQGHTESIAQAVIEGASGVAGATVENLKLLNQDIHEGRWKNDQVLATLASADAIIFGTPTYMGGYSAQMKAFIDACSSVWFAQGWKDKVAAGFTHSQGLSGDKLQTLTGLMINALQHGMIWVGPALMPEGSEPHQVNRIVSYPGLMAQSDYGQEAPGEGDLKTARLFGQRVAEATARWHRA
jgi:NAD(P)H dehydrogenase (quinone)